MNSKYKKILVISICILFILVSITNIIMSKNLEHLGHCELEECPICQLIHIAIIFLNSLNYLIIYTCLFKLVIPLIQIIKKIIKNRIQTTLIECKVQQNN